MAYTRKQVVSCLSVVYLVIVTAVAGYASSRGNSRSVPIPEGLTGATTVLPIISGLLLASGYELTRVQERRQRLDRGEIKRPPLVLVANTLIFIYSTVIITLLGTHVTPSGALDCGLKDQWMYMFRTKRREAIQTIQDAFNCCGFKDSHDMAWPFPDKSHDARACEKAFGRTTGCLVPWRAEEQKIAGILMGMVGAVFIWQFLIIVIPTNRESWLHQVAPESVSRFLADNRRDNQANGNGARRAIGYRDVEDISEEEVEEQGFRNGADLDDSPRVLEGGVNHIRNTEDSLAGERSGTSVWADGRV